ncbi:uncharacterized protein BDZ99DRAFT_299209 [Mytilinidion resinicola]|uniref:Uncharacterized protein n=1 Tax=Mytilinidion resinicola TaxID=574789 RepID=A0A6A6YM73_9PEZI|nr:uncharacterized protein BDZ99DRAFT_299209 [Mytilinidion resinicola]KAF2809881.1 hypothetical protein BDZ99DRAFT_299209 [Mytilinidion resinicola]
MTFGPAIVPGEGDEMMCRAGELHHLSCWLEYRKSAILPLLKPSILSKQPGFPTAIITPGTVSIMDKLRNIRYLRIDIREANWDEEFEDTDTWMALFTLRASQSGYADSHEWVLGHETMRPQDDDADEQICQDSSSPRALLCRVQHQGVRGL